MSVCYLVIFETSVVGLKGCGCGISGLQSLHFAFLALVVTLRTCYGALQIVVLLLLLNSCDLQHVSNINQVQ